jgi:hypothetical protein
MFRHFPNFHDHRAKIMKHMEMLINEESPTTTTFLNMEIDGQTCNIRDQT